MTRRLATRYVPELDFNALTDHDVHDLVTGIGSAAPNCAIVQGSQPLKDCVARLGTKDATLAASIALVTADRAKLVKDLGAEAEDRTDLHGEVRTYVTLFTNLAQSQEDLVSGGLKAPAPRLPRNTPPTVPGLPDVQVPKKGHGRVYVTANDPGTTKGQYVAQSCLDPVASNTWQQLGVGLGKRRVVTGNPGTKVWVRFAMVRAGTQSDWSIAVLVTIP